MQTLMGLPNELLKSIIDATGPEDIESFSTCCKLLYSLARHRLEEHRKKKSLFSTIFVQDGFLSYPQPFPSKKYGEPDTCLEEFFSDERNHLYPKVMVVDLDTDGIDVTNEYGGSRRARTSAINGLDEFEHQLKSRMEEVHNMIALEVGGVEAEDWGKHVKAGNPVATFLLLLALLPNLEELSIAIFGSWPETLSANFSNIMRLMIEAASRHKENGLSFGGRLSNCTVDGNLFDDIGESLLPFIMMLPNMQKFQGVSLSLEDCSWPYEDAVSPVVDLDFEGVIDDITFSNFIRGIRELERFRYYHTEGIHYWYPSEIVATLSQFAFSSLVYLDLTAFASVENSLFKRSYCIGSLRSFEVLEFIRLHYILLFEKVRIAGNADEVNSADTSENLLDGSLAKRQNLVDLLPSSVRIFRLEDIVKGEPILDTFEGFPEHRLERLPNLELISLDAGDEFNGQIEKICKEAGVQMESSKENSTFSDIGRFV